MPCLVELVEVVRAPFRANLVVWRNFKGKRGKPILSKSKGKTPRVPYPEITLFTHICRKGKPRADGYYDGNLQLKSVKLKLRDPRK
jgi:hypothetical protein